MCKTSEIIYSQDFKSIKSTFSSHVVHFVPLYLQLNSDIEVSDSEAFLHQQIVVMTVVMIMYVIILLFHIAALFLNTAGDS